MFVTSLEDPHLDDHDRHHLTRVLRLRPGAAVSVSDGRGRWGPFRLTADAALESAGPVEHIDRSGPLRTVATAIPKGDRPELIVQKLTELGVDRVVFIATARSVVRWESERAGRQLERLRRVAREAAMQSRRAWLPEVDGVLPLPALLDSAIAGLVAAEPGGRPLLPGETTVVIGPEGGFDDGEVPPDIARVGLGDTVLRVETAAIAAAALMADRSRDA